MPFQVKVKEATVNYSVTVYSRAGLGLDTAEYNVYWGYDNTAPNYLAGPLNSTSCTQLSAVSVPSGYNLWLKCVRDIGGQDVYSNFADSTTFCPTNAQNGCVWNAGTITGNKDVAITAYTIGGDLVDC